MTQNVTIRMDADLKKQAEELFSELGMDISTAITIFVRQSLRQRKIPFEISAAYPVPPGEEDDLFYSEKNLRHLQEAVRAADEGKFVEHELIEV
jgi:DNA-damage-inducible protein J